MAGNGDSRGDLDAVREDLSRLRTDLRDLLQKLIETGKSETGATKERVLDEINEAFELTTERSKAAVQSLENKVQENPLISVLLAFIIGFIFGKLFERR